MSFAPMLLALDAGALVLDAHGTVVFADRAALRSLGSEPDAVVGRPVEAVLRPLSTLTDHPLVRHVERYEDAAGAGWVVRVGDHESIAAERDRLLQLAAVSEVLPIVLHEIKNPLAAVQTALELALEEATDEALKEILHPIFHEIRRVARSLLGMGSVGRELRSSTHQAVDLAIEDATTLLVPTAQERNVELLSKVTAMPLLRFDVAVIRSIVFNLVRNALDACRPGDEVRVEASYEADVLALEVRDTGPGMPPDVVEHCRRLFFSTKSNGSGIGIPLCVRAVEGAGGTFSITSAVGGGTAIAIRLVVT